MRVLAICAHPDDIELSCAGTLIKCVKRGDEVFACHLSDGDLGHMEIMPEELGKIRCKEAENAAKVCGYHVMYGGFHDLDIYPESVEARNKVSEIIREIKPDFIITHSPEDYMADHVAVSKLVFDASFSASIPHYPSNIEKPCEVVPIFYMSPSRGVGFVPTFYVDITDEYETKQAAFLCHESQIVWLKDHDKKDPTESIYVSGRFWGRQCGVRFAEGFCQLNTSLKLRPKRLLP